MTTPQDQDLPELPGADLVNVDGVMTLVYSVEQIQAYARLALSEHARQKAAGGEAVAPWTAEELDEVVSSLGDDASTLLDANPEDEIGHNIQRAEAMLLYFVGTLSTTPQPAAEAVPMPKLNDPLGLVAVLRAGRQVDEDGTDIGVNRQAVDEAATFIEALFAKQAAATGQPVGHGDASLRKFLQKFADRAYCDGLDMFRRPLCLGWEAKVKAGQFTQDEFDAHAKANKKLGAHFGIHEAIKLFDASTPPTTAQAEQLKEQNK